MTSMDIKRETCDNGWIKVLTKKATSYRIYIAPSFNGIKTKDNDTEIIIKFNVFVLNSAKM